jgi:hypothetical protein
MLLLDRAYLNNAGCLLSACHLLLANTVQHVLVGFTQASLPATPRSLWQHDQKWDVLKMMA